MKDFKKYLDEAIKICEDYSTVTPDSDNIDMIWFTPSQLRKFTKYCQNQQKKYDNKKNED